MTDYTGDWYHCYDDSWDGIIVDEAFEHAAKFSAGLIRRIYKHGFERGYWQRGGQIVVTPGVLEEIRNEIDKGLYQR